MAQPARLILLEKEADRERANDQTKSPERQSRTESPCSKTLSQRLALFHRGQQFIHGERSERRGGVGHRVREDELPAMQEAVVGISHVQGLFNPEYSLHRCRVWLVDWRVLLVTTEWGGRTVPA